MSKTHIPSSGCTGIPLLFHDNGFQSPPNSVIFASRPAHPAWSPHLMALRKYDIINALARSMNLSRYLEICTSQTGAKFAFVDPALFPVRDRLMYRCPDTFDDGHPIAFRTASHGAQDLIRAIMHMQPPEGRYDIVFVDPWHTLQDGLADMQGAIALLRPGGVLVVHDCNPTDPETIVPDFREGAWCGLTFQAFIDTALAAAPTAYCTVDADFGVGLLFTGPVPHGLPIQRPGRPTLLDWTLGRAHDATRYQVFDRHRHALLNLVTPAAFAAAVGLELWSPRTHPTRNLLPNPCWADGARHWQPGADAALTPLADLPPTPGHDPTAGVLLEARPDAPPAPETDAAWTAPQGHIPGRLYDAALPIEPGAIYEVQAACLPRSGRLRLMLLMLDAAGAIVASPHLDSSPATGAWQHLVFRTEAPPQARTATILLRLLPGPDDARPAAIVTRTMLATTIADVDEDLLWTA